MPTKIQLRRGTAAQWTTTNTLLAEGEQGLETDTGKTKIGNGVANWNALPYAGESIGGTDTQVQFNDGGVFGGANGWTWNKTANTMTFGNVIGFDTGGRISAQSSYRSLIFTALTAGSNFEFSNAMLEVGSSNTTHSGIIFGNASSSNSPVLRYDAANTLAQRNGTNAQTFRLYNTFTDASNCERGFMQYSGNVLQIGHEGLGTGNNSRTIAFRTAGFNPLTLDSFNARFNVNIDVGTAFIDMTERSAPAAPAANGVRIYAEDNGAGKTRLMARFATGAAVQIAIEP